MRWQVTVDVGVFWVGPTYVLGTYRWRWLADLAARFHHPMCPHCFMPGFLLKAERKLVDG